MGYASSNQIHIKKKTPKNYLYVIKFRISWICLFSLWLKETALENFSVISEEATERMLPQLADILKEQLERRNRPVSWARRGT